MVTNLVPDFEEEASELKHSDDNNIEDDYVDADFENDMRIRMGIGMRARLMMRMVSI